MGELVYLAMFIVCSVSPINDWTGDRDTGATCVIAEKATFPTLDQCEFRLRDTLRVVRTKEEQSKLATRLKGPYTYDMSCKVTFGQGFLDCVDCDKPEPSDRYGADNVGT